MSDEHSDNELLVPNPIPIDTLILPNGASAIDQVLLTLGKYVIDSIKAENSVQALPLIELGSTAVSAIIILGLLNARFQDKVDTNNPQITSKLLQQVRCYVSFRLKEIHERERKNNVSGFCHV